MMKKAILTLAIVLGLGMFSFAGEDNQGGGLFGYGEKLYSREGEAKTPFLPNHGETSDQDADAPLGSGIVALIGFGAAYAFAKKREE